MRSRFDPGVINRSDPGKDDHVIILVLLLGTRYNNTAKNKEFGRLARKGEIEQKQVTSTSMLVHR